LKALTLGKPAFVPVYKKAGIFRRQKSSYFLAGEQVSSFLAPEEFAENERIGDVTEYVFDYRERPSSAEHGPDRYNLTFSGIVRISSSNSKELSALTGIAKLTELRCKGHKIIRYQTAVVISAV
jgi:hypothetical protein